MKGATSSTVNEYLARLPSDQKAALQRIRVIARRVVPNAEESISYGLPTFKVNGKPVLYFGAAKGHCAVYGAPALDPKELAKYDTSKGTIRFQPSKPLPATLIRKLIRARLAKYAAKKVAKRVVKRAR